MTDFKIMVCYHVKSVSFECSIHHIHREKNVVADILANDSISSERGTRLLRHPPAHLISAILDDIAGVALVRLLALNS